MLRAFTFFGSLLVILVLFEIVLRFLPVYEGARPPPVNENNPILHFEPDREFIWSRDWNFTIVNKVKTNNVGFVSDFDYDKDATSPLLAVIGDSYVEAFMVPYQQTCAGRLAKMLSPTARVYSFDVSGSPLSQYLAVAQYVSDTFRPDGLVIVVISNDYDESMIKYKNDPGFYYFVEQNNGQLALELVEYKGSFVRKALRKSALIRYLYGNLKFNLAVGRIYRVFGQNRTPVVIANEDTTSRVDPMRVADSKRAVDTFLDMLPESSGLKPERIVFVVDGMRSHLYQDDGLKLANGSYADVMRRYFIENAIMRGYEIIDMQPVFVAHYAAHQTRFEWPQDGHWNALGHELCFEEVARAALLEKEFSGLDQSSENIGRN